MFNGFCSILACHSRTNWEPVLTDLFSEFPVVADAVAQGLNIVIIYQQCQCLLHCKSWGRAAAKDCSGKVYLQKNFFSAHLLQEATYAQQTTRGFLWVGLDMAKHLPDIALCKASLPSVCLYFHNNMIKAINLNISYFLFLFEVKWNRERDATWVCLLGAVPVAITWNFRGR
jgi:hypothetical protein